MSKVNSLGGFRTATLQRSAPVKWEPTPSAVHLDEVTVPFPKTLLRRWNLAMFAAHLLLASVTLAVGNRSLSVPLFRTSLAFQVLQNGSYVTDDGDEEGVAFRLWPYYEEHGRLFLVDLTVAFFAVSAGFHLLNATLLWSFYVRMLERCYTPTRWIEYVVSAPIMFVLISYGLGVRARSDFIAGVALVATTMFFGVWTEREGRPASPTRWTRPFCVRIYPWVLGHVPQIAAWVIIVLQFYDNGWDSDRVPWFVHLILWGELILFSSFGAASLLSQCASPQHFYRGELAFQVLSLVSKGLLGVLLLTNILMLQRFDDIYKSSVESH